MTINENSQSLSWTGVLIKDLTNPFIRVENNTFVCDGIYFDDQQFIKYNLSIENCNTILPGSTISNNQFDLSNMINCRALNVFHASPYKQSDFVIEDNVITSINNKSLIFNFQTCDKFVCNNNYFNINQNPPYSLNLFYVVHHHGGANAVVESNVIVDNSKLREGIFIEAVDDRICHNAVYGCNQGLYIDGTGMDIYSNSMNDNTIGLTVNKVKPQRHTGNYWLGYNLIEGKCKSNPLLSIFISNQNNYNQNVKKYWPTSVTPNLFVHHDTVSPNDCFINLPFKYFLIDSYRINNLSEVEKWENDRLFIKTVLDSPQYLQSYDVYSYLSNFVNSNLYFLVNAEREIERRNYIPDTLLDKYYLYVSEYRQLSLLYSTRFNIVVLNDSLEYYNDSALIALSGNMSNYQDSINSINFLLDSESILLTMDSLVLAMEPTNYLEGCEKNLLLLRIKLLRGLEFDSTEIDYLLDISNQCDTSYGLLKVCASGLLNKFEDNEGNSNNCISESIVSNKNIALKKDSYFFHNNMILFSSDFIANEFEIFNLSGQSFKSKIFQSLGNENYIDVHQLASGLWLFRAVGKSEIISGKFFKAR